MDIGPPTIEIAPLGALMEVTSTEDGHVVYPTYIVGCGNCLQDVSSKRLLLPNASGAVPVTPSAVYDVIQLTVKS